MTPPSADQFPRVCRKFEKFDVRKALAPIQYFRDGNRQIVCGLSVTFF